MKYFILLLFCLFSLPSIFSQTITVQPEVNMKLNYSSFMNSGTFPDGPLDYNHRPTIGYKIGLNVGIEYKILTFEIGLAKENFTNGMYFLEPVISVPFHLFNPIYLHTNSVSNTYKVGTKHNIGKHWVLQYKGIFAWHFAPQLPGSYLNFNVQQNRPDLRDTFNLNVQVQNADGSDRFSTVGAEVSLQKEVIPSLDLVFRAGGSMALKQIYSFYCPFEITDRNGKRVYFEDKASSNEGKSFHLGIGLQYRIGGKTNIKVPKSKRKT